uniref:Uncharacterized protein LOC110215834 n=1 Tax=Phascolarctos cinereus TaxID=38626 RepID=A0A6P5L664_PHACI|nr:uncharacterized protein LOC110215834 [Phascolarctos cinereus]
MDDLQSMLQGIGVTVPVQEIQEAVKSIPASDDRKVKVKEFMTALTTTPFFTKASEIEHPLDILTSIRSNEVPVKDLTTIIKNMGIRLTPKELDSILQIVPLKEGEKVDLQKFMEIVSKMKSLVQDENNMIEVANLSAILDSMGMHLTPEEIQKAMKLVTVDDNGKVDLNKFMNSAQYNQKYSQLEGELVNFKKLRAFLNNSGIHLTEQETQEILKHVPIDENGDVNKKEFIVYMLNTRNPAQYEKNKVDVQKLEYLLGLMDIYLPEEEIQDVLQHIPIENGKVNLKIFMNAAQDIKKIPLYDGMKTAVQNLSNILGSMRVNVTDEKLQELLRNLSLGEDGSIDQNKVMEIVRSQKKEIPEGNEVDHSQLDDILKDLGVYLTEDELQELLKHHPEIAAGRIELDKVIDSLKNFEGQ